MSKASLAIVISIVSLVVGILGNITVLDLARSHDNDYRAMASQNCNANNTERITLRGALEDAKRRAKASIPPGPVQDREVGAIQRRIDQLSPLDCSF